MTMENDTIAPAPALSSSESGIAVGENGKGLLIVRQAAPPLDSAIPQHCLQSERD